MHLKLLLRWLPLCLIVIGLGCVFYFGWHRYLSFSALKDYHALLRGWAEAHYLLTAIIYIMVYIVAVALSVPGAVFITLTGGFLFGPIATLYVVTGATLGATLLFLAVRSALGVSLAARARGWVAKMEKGFNENAFNYLLILRLIPLFPFWAINVAAGLLAVRPVTFIVATFIGIIPGTFVYVMVGNGLSTVLASDQVPQLNVIFAPPILLPLLGLALLALLPVIYKRWKRRS
ncbi:TVP38/TMEM64 family inner membrane protein YdjZ [Aquicella lusitana]|uniref:TVP38/TMEM64 family membrane protein n=2 Tax=Aquicella lusitana TaxID=254246 RepID=A0A370GL21_9COXI|nr:putative membrane protein YdjX (TVP38/TMEM64 family) [Aquicella lusitana]VVC74361.1 TVP38/TMEM64 family inner membrane protein YdjZ [Aquicella lusitana]